MKIFENELKHIPANYLMMDARNTGPESPEDGDDLNDPDRSNDDEATSEGMGEDEDSDERTEDSI